MREADILARLLPRARAVLATLPAGPRRAEGERALDRAERVARGEAVAPRAIEDSLLNEDDKGILLYEQRGDDPRALDIWSAVIWVVSYAAWAAYAALGRPPSAMVEYFALPEALDQLEEALRTAEAGG